MYHASQIDVLDDAVAFIRRRPEMFAGEGGVRPESLAVGLAHDALALGVKQVEIRRAGDWWMVASDEDWLGYAYDGHLAARYGNLGTRDIFNRILPVPGRVNSCRSEVVIRALAGSVFTIRAGEMVVLTGDEAAIRGMLAHDPFCCFGSKRVVAFTMAPIRH